MADNVVDIVIAVHIVPSSCAISGRPLPWIAKLAMSGWRFISPALLSRQCCSVSLRFAGRKILMDTPLVACGRIVVPPFRGRQVSVWLRQVLTPSRCPLSDPIQTFGSDPQNVCYWPKTGIGHQVDPSIGFNSGTCFSSPSPKKSVHFMISATGGFQLFIFSKSGA